MPGARRLLGARQGPQSTLSTYENIYIGPVTALYERARDRSAQGPGFSLGGPGCHVHKTLSSMVLEKARNRQKFLHQNYISIEDSNRV